jgi:hypothetical protein
MRAWRGLSRYFSVLFALALAFWIIALFRVLG